MTSAFDREIAHVINSLVQPSSQSYPPTDIFVEDETLNFEFALAGFKIGDIDVEINGNKLYVAVKQMKKQENGREYIQHRLAYRPFEICYTIPGMYDPATAQCLFENGILGISMDQRPETKKRKLKIM